MSDFYEGDWSEYMLSHTPRQIAEEKGMYFAKDAYHVYCFCFEEILEPFSIDPADCIDSIPDDDYFESVFNQNYLGNTYGFTAKSLKLAFISTAVAACIREMNK